jgi:hypothetical protein
LSEIPALAPGIETDSRVQGIARLGLDKVPGRDRERRPFELRVKTNGGGERTDLARAVIDASGTWHNPNPLGANGLRAAGERELRARIAYGMPDIMSRHRDRYAGKSVAVVGAGYSAINVLLDLARLDGNGPETRITWIVRGSAMSRVYGGGEADELPARGRLGASVKSLVDRGRIDLVRVFHVNAVARDGERLSLLGTADGLAARIDRIDEIIACTGQRPELEMTRELRLDLDPWLEGTRALGPLIDPNVHSCGTVPPHGHRELSHPEPGFYTIGAKSYGRAPTFLLMTGYEQARSVVAAIAGDLASADTVELILPETGVCTDDADDEDTCCPRPEPADAAGCCGGPAKIDLGACCLADEMAKEAGTTGCGCGQAA